MSTISEWRIHTWRHDDPDPPVLDTSCTIRSCIGLVRLGRAQMASLCPKRSELKFARGHVEIASGVPSNR